MIEARVPDISKVSQMNVWQATADWLKPPQDPVPTDYCPEPQLFCGLSNDLSTMTVQVFGQGPYPKIDTNAMCYELVGGPEPQPYLTIDLEFGKRMVECTNRVLKGAPTGPCNDAINGEFCTQGAFKERIKLSGGNAKVTDDIEVNAIELAEVINNHTSGGSFTREENMQELVPKQPKEKSSTGLRMAVVASVLSVLAMAAAVAGSLLSGEKGHKQNRRKVRSSQPTAVPEDIKPEVVNSGESEENLSDIEIESMTRGAKEQDEWQQN